MVEVTQSVQYKSHEYNRVWTIRVQSHYVLDYFRINKKGEDRGEKVMVKLMRRKVCKTQRWGVLGRRKTCTRMLYFGRELREKTVTRFVS